MEASSFTLEFPEHLPRATWQYVLDQLAQTGAVVEEKSQRQFLVTCSKGRQLAHVGWALFHTHFRDICNVVATSGGARAQASAYPDPPPVRHGK
jgi:hypothetical protein